MQLEFIQAQNMWVQFSFDPPISFNCKFHHSRKEVLKNCSAFLCVNFSGERKFERIERKIELHVLDHNDYIT